MPVAMMGTALAVGALTLAVGLGAVALLRLPAGRSCRSARGSGLGLTIARGLVEAPGGQISAEARPGGGARVSFTLPAAS